MLSVELKNVVLNDETKQRIATRTAAGTTAVIKTMPLLEPVIQQLALLKPTWTFVATDAQRINAPSEQETLFHIDGFEVLEAGEELGHISRRFARNGYKIHVSNDRISKKRERGSGYSTDDPKKAIARVKKEFGRMNATERLHQAAESASNYAYQAANNHARKLRPYEATLKEAANAYLSGPGFGAFLQYLKDNEPSKYDQIVHAKEQFDELQAEMAVLLQIRDRLGSDKSALIVRDFEQYIVRVGDKVTLYDDTTLPAHMRGKLGLLKLVEKEHFVNGAGCRVSDEVFVVTLDDEEGEAK